MPYNVSEVNPPQESQNNEDTSTGNINLLKIAPLLANRKDKGAPSNVDVNGHDDYCTVARSLRNARTIALFEDKIRAAEESGRFETVLSLRGQLKAIIQNYSREDDKSVT